MNIIGKKVYLRAMEYEDMELFRNMTNNPELERKIAGWSFPISKEQQIQWYNNNLNSKNELRLSIVMRENDNLLGMLNLVNFDWKNGTAYHGIRLSQDAPKREGIGTDAVMALMSYAFDELRLNRLEGGWIENNTASQNLYLKCGWEVEGKQREAIYQNGQYYDFIVCGILKRDYYEVKKRLGY